MKNSFNVAFLMDIKRRWKILNISYLSFYWIILIFVVKKDGFIFCLLQSFSETPMLLHFPKPCMSDITNKPIARDTMHPKSAKRSRFCHKWVKNVFVFVFVCLFVFCTGVRFKVHLLRTPTPPSKTLGLGYRLDYKSQNFEPKEWE